MGQLTGGVQRIDVHHHRAQLEHGKQTHGVLEGVGQHDGHPVTLLDTLALQPGRKRADEPVQAVIAHLGADADEARPMTELVDALVKVLPQRAVLVRVDVVGHALDVRRQPDAVGGSVRIDDGHAWLNGSGLAHQISSCAGSSTTRASCVSQIPSLTTLRALTLRRVNPLSAPGWPPRPDHRPRRWRSGHGPNPSAPASWPARPRCDRPWRRTGALRPARSR